jgi:hypothetical protein
MASGWFLRAIAPLVLELIGVIFVAVGARGLMRKRKFKKKRNTRT